MEVFANVPFEPDVNAVMSQLRIPQGGEDAKHFHDLVEATRLIIKPKAVYEVCYIEEKGYDYVVISGVRFHSRALRVKLEKAERVFPYIATCGTEVDEISPAADDFVKRFWFDTIREAALRCSIEHLNNHLKSKYALGKSSSMNPGAGDKDVWPIEQQRELFSIFPDVSKQIGVILTESCLMIPNKSVSGIRFPTEVDFKSCQLCQREICLGRQAPFDKDLHDSLS
jgi:hypothetical protein